MAEPTPEADRGLRSDAPAAPPDQVIVREFACPLCHTLLDSPAPEAQALVCPQCSHQFPVYDGVVDFRAVPESSTRLGWALKPFEETYEKLGDWESIYDWDATRGIPADASTYKYARVKGELISRLTRELAGEPDLRQGLRLLDLGAGNGYFLLELRRSMDGAGDQRTFIGLDVSRHNILNLRKRAERDDRGDVKGLLASAEHIPLPPESVDVVVSSEALEHIADKEAALGEVHRILAPGGRFLFTTPSRGGLLNWDLLVAPVILVRRILKGRLHRKPEAPGFDQPASVADYRRMLAAAGFRSIEVHTGQMLNDEVITRIPRSWLGGYIALTGRLERSSLLRRWFGLHIIGYARK